MLGCLALGTVFESWAERRDHHASPAGSTWPHVGQDTIHLSGQGSLLVQPSVQQNSEVLSSWVAPAVIEPGDFPPWVQKFAVPSTEARGGPAWNVTVARQQEKGEKALEIGR